MDERVPFSEIQEAFGLVAQVTRPGDTAATSTTVVWSPTSPELMPAGMDFQGASSKRVISVSKADLNSLPNDTLIQAPEEEGGDSMDWIVDGQDRVEHDHWRVTVVPRYE